jgi:Ca-activated chloride channel family protein
VEFQAPYALLLLLALPVLLLWQLRGARSGATMRLSTLDAARATPATWRLWGRWVLPPLRLLAVVLLVLGLARPRSGQAEALIPTEGIDIALALDVSSSMRIAVGDQTPPLEAAQGVLEDFIQARENDRLALVVFRADTFLLSPPTVDYRALQSLVAQADQVDLPDGTAIGLAVADSLNLLRESKARSRVVVLVTDGENNRKEVEPLAAARIAEALGVRLYTIGIIDEARMKPGSARAGWVSVDEEALQSMAELSGGRYFRATDPDALAGVYQEIDRLERSRLGGQRFAAFHELAPFFLLPALALLALEAALGATLFRRLP